MSAIPFQKYTVSVVDSRQMGVNWFKKMYPDLSKIEEIDFENVAFDVFDVCKNLIGTESTSAGGPGFGGSHGEIRCAIAAAMGIAIEFDEKEVRHFNSGTIDSLTMAWNMNNHEAILARCAGYERNATNSVVDLLPVAKEVSESVYEILDDEDEVVVEIDPVVAEYAAVIGESTSVKRFITGNRHKRKPGKKPPTRIQKILDFSGVEK